MMQSLFLLLSAFFAKSVVALPNGPVVCLQGQASPVATGSPHGQEGSGSLLGNDIFFTLNGQPIGDGLEVLTGEEYTINLSTVDSFLGFLIRLENTDGSDSSGLMSDFRVVSNAAENTDLLSNPALSCAADVSSVGHNNAARMPLTQVIGTLVFESAGQYDLDVNVVRAVDNWFYSGFVVDVTEPAAPVGCAPGSFSIGNGVCICFSGESLVETKDAGVIRMKDVSLGDMVKVSHNKFEPVYSFGHYLQDGTFEYLVINNGLEISPAHMIAVQKGGFVPASTIKVGDYVADGSTDGGYLQVTSITTKKSKGMFAPFTPSGTIVTNGIVASSFISMQPDSAHLMVGGINTGLTWQFLAHSFARPHRLACQYFNFVCTEESYTKNGMSTWIAMPHAMSMWLLEQNVIVQLVILTPILTLVGIVAVVVNMVTPTSSIMIWITVVLALLMYPYRQTRALKSKTL